MPEPSTIARSETPAKLALVVIGVAAALEGRHALLRTPGVAWVLWAPCTSVLLLLALRVVRSSPMPALLASAAVAFPLLSTIALAFLSSNPLRALRSSSLDALLDATVRVAIVGFLLAGEGFRPQPMTDRAPRRREPVLALMAIAILVLLVRDASRAAALIDGGVSLETFDVATVKLLRTFATTVLTGAGEVALLTAIAAYALFSPGSYPRANRVAGLVLLASALGALLPLIPLRTALAGHVDPLATALELGILPPAVTRSTSLWVGSSTHWHPWSPVLRVGEGTATYFKRARRVDPLKESALPPLPDSDREKRVGLGSEPIIVLTSGATRFDGFLSGLATLGPRRHGLWLAVAPAGWESLGSLRTLSEQAEAIALGVEPRLLTDHDEATGPTDPILREMDPEGRALSVVLHNGQTSLCSVTELTVVAGRLRSAPRGACPGPFPLDDSPKSKDERLAVIRQTGVRRVVLAPEPTATMDEVVDVMGRLGSDVAQVMLERWNQACPPPTLCEPHVSFETGSPIVWLSADSAASEK